MRYLKRPNVDSILVFALFVLAAFGMLVAGAYPQLIEERMLYVLLVFATACYAWAAHSHVRVSRKANVAAIRPYIVATRLSPRGEIGLVAGSEGMNPEIHVMNAGPGHAHHVNVRMVPPAEAFAERADGRVVREQQIHVLHQLEMPSGAKRLWSSQGGFCAAGAWRYMYAEYEDIDGNEYYSIQSGYSLRTGNTRELGARKRKEANDPFWNSEPRTDWLKEIDEGLKEWALKQKGVYERRQSGGMV